MEIFAKFSSIPDTLNVPSSEGVPGRMVVRRYVDACCLTYDPGAGEADSGGANGKLVGGAAKKGGDRPGV